MLVRKVKAGLADSDLKRDLYQNWKCYLREDVLYNRCLTFESAKRDTESHESRLVVACGFSGSCETGDDDDASLPDVCGGMSQKPRLPSTLPSR